MVISKFLKITQKTKKYILIGIINIFVFLGLFIFLEIGMHILYPYQNPLISKGDQGGMKDPHYTHSLRSNIDIFVPWGGQRPSFHLLTNSLGFRDAFNRVVPNTTELKRLLFIGDSFTEGVGLDYEKTFVGLLSSANPQFDILNAGVSSYAPSVYYEKVKYYIEHGLVVDEVIVYIDISDMQDEAINYFRNSNGGLEYSETVCHWDDLQLAKNSEAPHSYLFDFFKTAKDSYVIKQFYERASLSDLILPNMPYNKFFRRASWTYDPNNHCFGKVGIEGAISKAREEMNKLWEFLHSNNIDISVAVYPWPHQLLYDQLGGQQEQIWKEWCEGKCKNYINHFPSFFKALDNNINNIKSLYIWGDFHFNEFGNAIIYNDLIKLYFSQDHSIVHNPAEYKHDKK